jgi:polyphosphate kinase 2 (PPK2 family)
VLRRHLPAADVDERSFWERYRHAYEEILTHTGTDAAPWYIVPADHDWFARAAVANIIVAELESLDPNALAGQRQRA